MTQEEARKIHPPHEVYGEETRMWNIDTSINYNIKDLSHEEVMELFFGKWEYKGEDEEMDLDNIEFVDDGTPVKDTLYEKRTYRMMDPKFLHVKFKKLHDNAVLPKYAKDGDAGMDCYTVSGPIIKPTYIAYDLGFAVEIPYGYVGLLFPRSSISKQELILANSVGVIDAGYRGPVQARFKSTSDKDLGIDKDLIYDEGDAVCQLMILPYPTVQPAWADELSDTERGEGGFGSTGK